MNEEGEASDVPLKFQIGARTLMQVQRALVRVPLSLDQVLADAVPPLPRLPRDADGYAVTSLPENRTAELVRASDGMIPFVRQEYTRYYTDLSCGFDAWFAGLSSNTRQQARRKARRIAALNGGELDVRRFRTADEMEDFHDVARRNSIRTYQERLMGGGLPDTPEFLEEMERDARADAVRAWLLYIAGEPAAYLYCPIVDGTVLYAHVGHDPAFNDLSPGSVLQLEALRDLFEEGRWRRFDFTEGEGQHKRTFASGGVACVDLFLFRPSLANRLAMASLGAFDRMVALMKRIVLKTPLKGAADRVRRG